MGGLFLTLGQICVGKENVKETAMNCLNATMIVNESDLVQHLQK